MHAHTHTHTSTCPRRRRDGEKMCPEVSQLYSTHTKIPNYLCMLLTITTILYKFYIQLCTEQKDWITFPPDQERKKILFSDNSHRLHQILCTHHICIYMDSQWKHSPGNTSPPPPPPNPQFFHISLWQVPELLSRTQQAQNSSMQPYTLTQQWSRHRILHSRVQRRIILTVKSRTTWLVDQKMFLSPNHEDNGNLKETGWDREI